MAMERWKKTGGGGESKNFTIWPWLHKYGY